MSQSVTKNIKRYAITFLIGAFVFYIITDMAWFENVRQVVLDVFASISSRFLSILGYGTIAQKGNVSSDQFSVSIKEGCDALAPIILYALATLLYPTSWNYRIKGWFWGILTLFLLNVVRIVSLFMIGIHIPQMFDVIHFDIWQVLFIVCAATLWMYWVSHSSMLEINE